MKLFRKKKENSSDLDKVLQMHNPTSIVMELDERINKLSSNGEDLTTLTVPQQVFLFIENLEREVNNGGFSQFFLNSSGAYAHETLNALKTIGAYKIADITTEAYSVWPGQTVPKDSTERYNLHEQIEEQAEKIWEQCDQAFYKYPDDISSLLVAYVKQHKTAFKQ